MSICGVLGRDVIKQGTQFYTQQLVELTSDSAIKSISSGITHGVILTENNELYTWGNNSLGQLGFHLSESKSQ